MYVNIRVYNYYFINILFYHRSIELTQLSNSGWCLYHIIIYCYITLTVLIMSILIFKTFDLVGNIHIVCY